MATVGLTLEQLDQFGSLDALAYSPDSPLWNSTDQKDVTGPWSIDGIDAFNTNLDALAFSLDSPVWNTATLR